MKKIIMIILSLLGTTGAFAEESKKPHLISIMAGYGDNGHLETVTSGSTTAVGASKGFLSGVQYQYIFADEVSVGAVVLINGSVLGSAGLKF